MSTFLSPATGNLMKKKRLVRSRDAVSQKRKCTEHRQTKPSASGQSFPQGSTELSSYSCLAWELHMPIPTAPSALMTLAHSQAQTSLGCVCLSLSVPKKLTSTGRSNLGPFCLISGCFLNYRVTYSKGWPNLLVPLPARTNLHMIPHEAPSPRLTF